VDLHVARTLLSSSRMGFHDRYLDSPISAAFFLWDYFYIENYPTDAEKRAWRRIECAAKRMVESTQFLGDELPAAVRVKNAKRVRRAAREAMRLSTEKLETIPDQRVAIALGMLEGCAQRLIDACADDAAAQPLH